MYVSQVCQSEFCLLRYKKSTLQGVMHCTKNLKFAQQSTSLAYYNRVVQLLHHSVYLLKLVI